MTISPEGKELIDLIVGKQEGGWVLSENKGDNDGGWTFGGVTANTFNKLFRDVATDAIFYRLDCKESLNEQDTAQLIERGYEIYQSEFIKPLQLFSLPSSIRGPLLSCAINCGVKEAVMILQRALNAWDNSETKPLVVDGNFGDETKGRINSIQNYQVWIGIKTQFLREWMRYYIKLCDNNNDPKSILHSQFLEGWFNRVEFWRI